MAMPSCESKPLVSKMPPSGRAGTDAAVGEDAVDVHQDQADFDGAGGDLGAD